MTKFYSPEFKQEMLHYVQPHPDRTLCSIAEEFDVSYSSLKTWVRNAKNSMPSSPSTTRSLKELEQENRRLQKALDIKEKENELLKKFSVYLAKLQP